MAAPSKAAVVLKAVKRIAVHFSPFESNVRSTRYESRFLSVDIVLVFLFFFFVVIVAFATQIPMILEEWWNVLSGCCDIIGKMVKCSGPTRLTTS